MVVIMKKKPVKYFMVDAFTDSAFRGNPAAVCFLNDDNDRDDTWLQSLAAEFNITETCFLTPITNSEPLASPCFSVRWFAPLTEVDICGHTTLATAHYLFSKCNLVSWFYEFGKFFIYFKWILYIHSTTNLVLVNSNPNWQLANI